MINKMESYTDFGVSYIIQTFVNKTNTNYEITVELKCSCIKKSVFAFIS